MYFSRALCKKIPLTAVLRREGLVCLFTIASPVPGAVPDTWYPRLVNVYYGCVAEVNFGLHVIYDQCQNLVFNIAKIICTLHTGSVGDNSFSPDFL